MRTSKQIAKETSLEVIDMNHKEWYQETVQLQASINNLKWRLSRAKKMHRLWERALKIKKCI